MLEMIIAHIVVELVLLAILALARAVWRTIVR